MLFVSIIVVDNVFQVPIISNHPIFCFQVKIFQDFLKYLIFNLLEKLQKLTFDNLIEVFVHLWSLKWKSPRNLFIKLMNNICAPKILQKHLNVFFRSLSGLYLRHCVPCDCNGLSNKCNPESGECFVSYNCLTSLLKSLTSLLNYIDDNIQ